MGFLNDLFSGWLGQKKPAQIFLDDCAWLDTTGQLYARNLALGYCVNMIANAVGKCEFKTYKANKEAKAEEYYLWNFEPNPNQNGSEFLHQLITKLLIEGECLVIEPSKNNKLYVADSFTLEPKALTEDRFTNITVKGHDIKKVYKQSDVLYFKLSEAPSKLMLQGIDDLYKQLFASSVKAYKKSAGSKYKYTYDTIPPAGSDERAAFDKLISEGIKKFLESDDAAMPVGKGYDFVEVGAQSRAAATSRDIKALVDDVCEIYAKAFGIPPQFLTSTVDGIGDAFDQFMTNCITPIVELIAKEINRKRYGYEAFAKGDYLEVDTDKVVYHDVFKVATSIDKLVASGAQSINDIRRKLNEPIIFEDYANALWMTKNYAPASEVLNMLTG